MDSYVLSEIVNDIRHEKELSEKIQLFYEEVNEKVNQKGLELKEFKDYIISLLIKNEFDSNTLDNLVKISNSWLSLWNELHGISNIQYKLMEIIESNYIKSKLNLVIPKELSSLLRNKVFDILSRSTYDSDIEEEVLVSMFVILRNTIILNSNWNKVKNVEDKEISFLDAISDFIKSTLNDFFECSTCIYSFDIKCRLKKIQDERFVDGITDLLKTNELGGWG